MKSPPSTLSIITSPLLTSQARPWEPWTRGREQSPTSPSTKKKMRIRLRAGSTQKRLPLRRILTLMKIANTSILTIPLQDLALICKFLRFRSQDLVSQPLALVQAIVSMLLLRDQSSPQRLVLVLGLITLVSISARRPEKVRRSRLRQNRGVPPWLTTTWRYQGLDHMSPEIPWRINWSIKFKEATEGSSAQLRRDQNKLRKSRGLDPVLTILS